MKNGGIDRRIIKTKKVIRVAFKDLVQQKDMSEITISELTKSANITRSTFYMYYKTVEDVRAEIENEIIADISKSMTKADVLRCLKNPYQILRILAEEVAQHDENNRYILSSNNSGRLLDKIGAQVTGAVMDFIQENNVNVGDVGRAKYIVAFAVAGTMKCFQLWFNHESTLTLEELCLRISDTLATTLPFLKEVQ